jgi:nucleotide-binding universal stress UspA family protein
MSLNVPQEQESLLGTESIIIQPDGAKSSGTDLVRVIAIALDASVHSQYCFEWAMTNVVRPSDLVVLISVRPIATVPGPFGVSLADTADYLAQIEEEHRRHSHALLQQYAQHLKKAKISCKAIAMRGDPRDELVRKVGELHADMLIMGSRGMGALKRTFLGSVSDHVIHHCACPVVIVKVHFLLY